MSAPLPPAQAGVELGRFTKRDGVHGGMTGGPQAAAAALCCQGVRAFSESRVPRTTNSGTP